MPSDSTLRRRAREAQGLCWDCASPSEKKRCPACIRRHKERERRAFEAHMAMDAARFRILGGAK